MQERERALVTGFVETPETMDTLEYSSHIDCVCFNKSYENSVHSTMHFELVDSESPPPLQVGVNERCVCS
jgi:hypothetical protein